MVEPTYIHLPPGQVPPRLSASPFKALVIVEEPVTADWRSRISKWLVRSGCLYMLAWGHDCSLWDDSVDFAMLDEFEFGDIPEDKFVMTTWHENETLAELFWFTANAVYHPLVQIDRTILVHVAQREDGAKLLAVYNDARLDRTT